MQDTTLQKALWESVFNAKRDRLGCRNILLISLAVKDEPNRQPVPARVRHFKKDSLPKGKNNAADRNAIVVFCSGANDGPADATVTDANGDDNPLLFVNALNLLSFHSDGRVYELKNCKLLNSFHSFYERMVAKTQRRWCHGSWPDSHVKLYSGAAGAVESLYLPFLLRPKMSKEKLYSILKDWLAKINLASDDKKHQQRSSVKHFGFFDADIFLLFTLLENGLKTKYESALRHLMVLNTYNVCDTCTMALVHITEPRDKMALPLAMRSSGFPPISERCAHRYDKRGEFWCQYVTGKEDATATFCPLNDSDYAPQ